MKIFVYMQAGLGQKFSFFFYSRKPSRPRPQKRWGPNEMPIARTYLFIYLVVFIQSGGTFLKPEDHLENQGTIGPRVSGNFDP